MYAFDNILITTKGAKDAQRRTKILFPGIRPSCAFEIYFVRLCGWVFMDFLHLQIGL
jgi:hypothetical protein